MLETNQSEIEISIVSPVYMSASTINILVDSIAKACNSIGKKYEIILVDDDSKDKSWNEIKKCCLENKFIKGIKLSRNFGQHIAINAGLKQAKGNWIVVLDCDMQDNPKEIPRLYFKAIEGYSIVRARRINRQDNLAKKISSIFFYKVFEYLTGVSQDSSIANFGIYHRNVIEALKKMNDKHPYFPSQINWVGFSKYDINVKHRKSMNRKSTYNLRKLFSLALNNILSFSDKPLKIAVYIGFIISVTSFLLSVLNIIMALLGVFSVSGFASIIITLFFSTGVIVFVVGVVGLYIGKIFESSKERPLYIIEEKFN